MSLCEKSRASRCEIKEELAPRKKKKTLPESNAHIMPPPPLLAVQLSLIMLDVVFEIKGDCTGSSPVIQLQKFHSVQRGSPKGTFVWSHRKTSVVRVH